MNGATDPAGGDTGGQSERPCSETNYCDRIRRVLDVIAKAAELSGRNTDEVSLLAVTKYKDASVVRAAADCGLKLFGENYIQEGAAKKAVVAHAPGAEWHLIGHLQTNKAGIAVRTFDVIQTLDSERLATSLSKKASEYGIVQRVLIQVRLGDEPTKTGVAPDRALDLAALVASLPGLSLEGLMGIAPLDVDPRPHFRSLKKLFEGLPGAHRKILSMGMSSDFETAILEGSTMVRIGTALFGSRQ